MALRHLLLDCLSPRIIDARRRFVADVLTLTESHDVENDTTFSSLMHSRYTLDFGLRLRLSNSLHDGTSLSFFLMHIDLLSRFQQTYLNTKFPCFIRSLFKLIRIRLWNDVWTF